MPVSGNQEPGVLFRHTSICSSGIPIKKRRFPYIPLPSPPREEGPAPFSELNTTENEPKSTVNDLSEVANTLKDSIQKSEVIKNSLEVVKKEMDDGINGSSTKTDICREPQSLGSCQQLQTLGSFPPTQLDVKNEVQFVLNSVQNNDCSGKCYDEEIRPAVTSDSVDKANNNFNGLVNEISTSHAVPKSNLRFPIRNVKKEMVNIRSGGDYKHERSTTLENTKLTSNEQLESSLEKQEADLSTKVPYKLVPPLLSLSLSEATLPEKIGADKTVIDSNVIMSSTDRKNWDLNTTMDAWEGSIEDSVLLNLSTSSSQDCSWVMPHLILQRPIISSISSGSRTVKSEPVDDNLKADLSLVPSGIIESLDNGLVDKNSEKSVDKTLVGNFWKVIEPTSFISEASHDSNQESHSPANFTLKRPSSNVVQLQESCSSSSTVVSGSVTPQQYFVSKLTTFSELSDSVVVSDQSGHYSNNTENFLKDIMNPFIISQIPGPVNNYVEDPNACDDGKVNSSEAMTSSLQRSNGDNIKPNTITEESASRKEEIFAMAEGHSCGSACESNGKYAIVSQMGRDGRQCEKLDDDYEDGEVRESPLKSLVRVPNCEGMLSENSKEVDDGCEMVVPANQSTINEKHSDIKLHEQSNDHNEHIEAMTIGNHNQLVSGYVSLLVTESEQVASEQTEAKVPEKLVNVSVGENEPGVKENDLMGDGETDTKDMELATVSVAGNENDKGSDEAGMNDQGSNVDRVPDLFLTKEEVPVYEHGSFKGSALGGNRSRIIHLPRASNSPLRIRSLSGRSFTSWSGSERYGDVDGNNLHYRGHRDDTYGDDFRKFSRDRSFRNSRTDFKRDRGRDTNLFDSVQNKWDPEHDFPPTSFDVSADYRFNRHRRGSAVADNGLRSKEFVVPPGGSGPNASRIGRNNLIEGFRSFHQPSSRRLSPGSRDGAPIRSFPNSRRLPESGSDLPGRRHEKFLRGLPDDMTGSIYTRSQASYDEMSGQFVNRNQDYSTGQRRVFPRARSKSPNITQSRAPGTWPSSRRRINDDFNNPSDQIQQRLVYKEEMMRSPDRVCYTDELGDRRRVSPNYETQRANEMRDMDFAREQGNLRSISSNRRSPSDRVFPRSARRLDVLDSRERTDSDKYFSGPINSGRFHEFRSDGSNDERRKFGERRVQFRPSRPSYGGGNENYRPNAEDGSVPLRFCSDQDAESFERSNIRQRGFNGGTKTCTLIAQRQIRSTEDQEGSFGQSGQVWHDESFSDGSRMKRRRF